ncbi:MAG: hypothetical protein J6R38_03385 [Alistipes sp.]|nr:hypothetical protein [Alistipes sp.]
MKNLNRIVFLLFATVSVALVAWAIVVGMAAPDSSKIAGNAQLINLNDEGVAEPVRSTAHGIEELGKVFATQLEEGILSEQGIADEKLKLENTRTVLVPEYEAKVGAKAEVAKAADAVVAELAEVKKLSAAQKKKLAEAQAVQADFKALNDTLNVYKENIAVMEENIAASEKANAQAQADAANIIALSTAISVNIMWFYFLLVFAFCIIIINTVMNLFQNKGGLGKTLAAICVVAAVIGVSYVLATTHGWADGATLKDAAGYDLGLGTDLATRKVFGPFEYMLADASILVTYITFAGAALAAILSAVRGVFKS